MSDQYQEVQENEVSTQPEVGAEPEKAIEPSDDYSDGFNAAVSGEPEAKAVPEDSGGTGSDGGQKPEEKEESSQPKPDVAQEEDETQKDNYKSLLGRHQRLQDEIRQLRDAQQKSLSQQQSQPEQKQSFEKADIPEELKDDVEAFKKQYPEYSALIELKGREGDRIRGILSEYGTNLAAVQAENLVTRLELVKSRQEVSQRVNQQAERQAEIIHEQQIFSAHPDFASLEPAKKREFLEGMEEWIGNMPFKEARHWNKVFENGKTHETIKLFSEYKRYCQNNTTTQNNSQQKNNASRRQQAIDDGLAVPASARGARAGTGVKPDVDVYTSGFLTVCGGR